MTRASLRGWIGVGLLFAGLWSAPVTAGRITNEPTGFNGYLWGASSTDYPSLVRVTDPAVADPVPDVDVYEKPGETLIVNGATLTRIHYRFYKGKLGGIGLRYEGREYRDKLMQWIEQEYGKLPPVERKQKQIEWHGENVVITLGYDVLTSRGHLWFTYLALTPFQNTSGVGGTATY
jgi:hypothetical protein